MTSSNPTTLEWPPRYIEQQNTLRLNDGQTTVHMKSPSLGPGLSSDGVLPPIQAERSADVKSPRRWNEGSGAGLVFCGQGFSFQLPSFGAQAPVGRQTAGATK